MRDAPDTAFLDFQAALAGRYSLQRELGRGGMGIVYLAQEVRLDRPVALKLLPPEMAAQGALRERFMREARTAAKLSQPNIVPIYAVEDVDDFVFFSMMYVEGQTLGQRVRERGPLPPHEAARILREVAWALAYAHGQGVVHRDVKPDNILIEEGSGRALVTDFGIAHVSDVDGLTTIGDMLGTAEFMSPEQASGEEVDERSDLYSLGVVGHFMLSGQLPFEGGTAAATLAKHLTQPAPELASVAPTVPRTLSSAIDRCLLKEPGARFGGGEELAAELGRVLEAKRDVPAPIRLFMEQTRESTTQITAAWVGGLIFMIAPAAWFLTDNMPPTLVIVAYMFFWAAMVAVPPFLLSKMARRVLAAGYGYEDVVLALSADVERAREQVAEQHGEQSELYRWANRVMKGGLGVGALSTLALFGPYVGDTVAAIEIFGMLTGSLVGGAAGIFVATTHQLRGAIPGQRWLKLWKSKIGKALFRVAAARLEPAALPDTTFRPTEMAIGMAADRLYEELPADVRAQFGELPGVVEALEGDAERMRARVKELDRVLADVEGEEALARSGRAAADPHVGDKRASLAEDVRATRDAAEQRLSEAVAALETIRLGLLRMHAGAGSVESLTADLSSARNLSDHIQRALDGRDAVEELLGAS